MRIVIDWDLCQGHGNCMADAPDVFLVDEKGKLTVLQESPPESLLEGVRNAVEYCPTGAVSIQND